MQKGQVSENGMLPENRLRAIPLDIDLFCLAILSVLELRLEAGPGGADEQKARFDYLRSLVGNAFRYSLPPMTPEEGLEASQKITLGLYASRTFVLAQAVFLDYRPEILALWGGQNFHTNVEYAFHHVGAAVQVSIVLGTPQEEIVVLLRQLATELEQGSVVNLMERNHDNG